MGFFPESGGGGGAEGSEVVVDEEGGLFGSEMMCKGSSVVVVVAVVLVSTNRGRGCMLGFRLRARIECSDIRQARVGECGLSGLEDCLG